MTRSGLKRHVQDDADLDALVRVLADRLADVPGLDVTVTRRHGLVRRLLGDLPYANDLHRRDARVTRIIAAVGGRHFELAAQPGELVCEIRDAPAGAVGRAVEFREWASELFGDIEASNARYRETVEALRGLMERGQV